MERFGSGIENVRFPGELSPQKKAERTFELGCYFHTQGAYEGAFRELSSPLLEKNGVAQLLLGVMILSGQIAGKSAQDAAKYLTNSANLGNASGKYMLADMLRVGKGLPKDDKEAWRLYKESQAGLPKEMIPELQFRLAIMLNYGVGTEKNLGEANRLFRQSANGGCLQGKIELAKQCWNGRGIPQDVNYAFDLLKQVAETTSVNLHESANNNPAVIKEMETHRGTAYNLMGFMCLSKKGKGENYSDAKICFENAAKFGNALALGNLAFMSHYGLGVKADQNLAQRYFDESVKIGWAAWPKNIDEWNAKLLKEAKEGAEAGNYVHSDHVILVLAARIK